MRTNLFVLCGVCWALASPGALSGEIALVLHPFEGPTVMPVEQALAKAKIKAQDVSWIKHQLTESLQGISFGNLLASKPTGWPASLDGQWADGIERCKKIAGSPPYGVKNPKALMCGKNLGAVLWQRFLEEKNFEKVLEIEIEPAADPQKVQRFQVTAFRPEEKTARFLDAGVTPTDKLPERLAEWIRRTLAGEGTPQERVVQRDFLPEAGAALKEGQVYDLPAIQVPEGCGEKLPRTLRVLPEDAPFAKTLLRRYEASVSSLPHNGPELECRIELQDMGAVLASAKQHSYWAQLVCGERKWQAKTYHIHPIHSEPVQKALSRDLLKQFFSGMCQAR